MKRKRTKVRQRTRPVFERLIFIARALRANERINMSVVATDLEVSTRTVQRDFEFLRDRMRWDIEWIQSENSFQLIHAPTPTLL